MAVLDMAYTSNALAEDVFTLSLREVPILMAVYSLALLLWRRQGGHAGIAARYMPVPVAGLQFLIEDSITVTVLQVSNTSITLAVGVITTTLCKESILLRQTHVASTHLLTSSCGDTLGGCGCWHSSCGGGVVRVGSWGCGLWEVGSCGLWVDVCCGRVETWHGCGIAAYLG